MPVRSSSTIFPTSAFARPAVCVTSASSVVASCFSTNASSLPAARMESTARRMLGTMTAATKMMPTSYSPRRRHMSSRRKGNVKFA